jgi:hypothetical protein
MDPALRFALIPYAPNPERERPASTRWPFYVDAPLTVALALDRIGSDTQWCEFRFTPGKTYTERESG